jgi:hypothetical protein
MAALRERLDGDPDLSRKFDELRRSNERILAAYPPERILSENVRLSRPAPSRAPRRALLALPLVAAAAALIGVLLLDREGPPGIRTKGPEGVDVTRTQLLIFKKTGTDNVLLKDGDTVRAGDLLQVAYVPAGLAFGVILSIDGNGQVTLHHPQDETGAGILSSEPTVLLDSSYELDAAPEFERFFFVASTSSLSVREVVDKARELASSGRAAGSERLDLSGIACRQFSILLRKAG